MSDDMLHGTSPRTLAAVEALAEAIFATADGPPPRPRIEWLSREIDDFLARAGARSRFVYVLSVTVVSVVAPLLIGKFAALRALALPDRSRALEKMERGRMALPLLAVKAMLCILYYEHP